MSKDPFAPKDKSGGANKKTEKRKAERERAAARNGGRKRASKSIRRREPKVNERRDRPGEAPRTSIWKRILP